MNNTCLISSNLLHHIALYGNELHALGTDTYAYIKVKFIENYDACTIYSSMFDTGEISIDSKTTITHQLMLMISSV